jgi:nicotinamidase-related amidase
MATRDAFLAWLDGWYDGLPERRLADLVAERPERVALLVVDLLVGFCSEGPLASPRLAALGPPTAQFLTASRAMGVHHVLLAMDAHPEGSPEFAAFPPHCIRGTAEAELIPELEALPFSASMVRLPKGSLNVGLEPALAAWQAEHPEVDTWIVIGDCTDLCVYQAAMHLRLQANARGQCVDTYVPTDLVETYDLPVDVAGSIGALPHDGDFLHRLFLYHMALNGVQVVRRLQV